MPSDTPFKDYLDVINGTRSPRNVTEAGQKAMHDLSRPTPIHVAPPVYPESGPQNWSSPAHSQPAGRRAKRELTRQEAGTRLALFAIGSLILCWFSYFRWDAPELGKIFGVIFLITFGALVLPACFRIIRKLWWAFLIFGVIVLYALSK